MMDRNNLNFIVFIVYIFFVNIDLAYSLSSNKSLGNLKKNVENTFSIGIIGGGASGMFASVAAAAELKNHFESTKYDDLQVLYKVCVLESTQKIMTKVSISGGGRCNVMHDTAKPVSELLNGYPRGKKELNGILNRHFTPHQARHWFESRGVKLKTEADGRMFPKTDSSQTIIDCINGAAMECGVEVKKKHKVKTIRHEGSQFVLETMPRKTNDISDVMAPSLLYFDCIIIATGSDKIGYNLASRLNHTILPPVPSLFTFNTKDEMQPGGLFHGLQGTSVQHVKVSLKLPASGKRKNKIISQEGPILVTHHGISGPAVLRLSAFAASDFFRLNYKTELIIHWAPAFGSREDIEAFLWDIAHKVPKRTIASSCPFLTQAADDFPPSPIMTKRLWSAFVLQSGFSTSTKYAEAQKQKIRILSSLISDCVVQVSGKGVFKEEFVTAGGVCLKEITIKTMESKKCPGLYFCGEVINVDGVTGGFNFMNCWSTGYVAGKSAANRLIDFISG